MKEYNYPCDIGPSKMVEVAIQQQRYDVVLKHLSWLSQNSILMTSVICQIGIENGHVDKAAVIFNRMDKKWKTISIYNAMMKVYNNDGKCNESINLYVKWLRFDKNGELNDISYTILFNACSKTLNIEIGNQLYDCWSRNNNNSNLQLNDITCNALIDMCGNFGDLTKAVNVFNKIENPDVITYGCLMKAYNKNDCFGQTLELFTLMTRVKKVKIDVVCYSLALKAAGKAVSLKQGNDVASHLMANLNAKKINNHVWSSLISMQGKCGNYNEAIKTFDKIKNKNCDSIIYNSVLDVYSKMGDMDAVLRLYNEMKQKGILY